MKQKIFDPHVIESVLDGAFHTSSESEGSTALCALIAL